LTGRSSAPIGKQNFARPRSKIFGACPQSNRSFYKPGFNPNTQRRDPSGRRHIVTWPSGGATGIASSNGTSSPSIIQPLEVDDARV
jgi:hypothetical protein